MKVHIGKYPKKGERKVKIHIDKFDTWGMDTTLSMIIVPMLHQLKKTKHGYPYTDPEDVPHIGEGKRENEYDFDENAEARWDWILDEMIWAHEQVIDENAEDQFHSGKIDIVWVPVEEEEDATVVRKGKKKKPKFYEMEHGPNHTHKWDKEAWEKWDARKRNGLKLFGKYYQNLWD